MIVMKLTYQETITPFVDGRYNRHQQSTKGPALKMNDLIKHPSNHPVFLRQPCV